MIDTVRKVHRQTNPRGIYGPCAREVSGVRQRETVIPDGAECPFSAPGFDWAQGQVQM